MKNTLAFLSSVLIAGCASISGMHDFTFERQATKMVQVGEMGHCSGVVVAPTHILTAAHCDNAKLMVNGKEAKVIKKSEIADLMLLQVEVDCPCVNVADKRPGVDSLIYTIGFPMWVGQVLTTGRMQVEDFKVDEEMAKKMAHMMLVTSPVINGNSGGPVFNIKGELVGIVSAVAAVNGGFYSSVPITHLALVANTETIKEFLKVGIRGGR